MAAKIDRAAFLKQHAKPTRPTLTKAMKDDMAWFIEQRAQGKAIGIAHLIRYIEQQYGLKVNKYNLAVAFDEAGLAPWWQGK